MHVSKQIFANSPNLDLIVIHANKSRQNMTFWRKKKLYEIRLKTCLKMSHLPVHMHLFRWTSSRLKSGFTDMRHLKVRNVVLFHQWTTKRTISSIQRTNWIQFHFDTTWKPIFHVYSAVRYSQCILSVSRT